MLQTKELLSARFPNGVELIIIGYVQSKKRSWKHIAAAGEYEICLDIPQNKLNSGLQGACRGGHLELTMLMISHGADDWNNGLYGACRGGHLELTMLMISKGADNWDHSLQGACRGGHLELARLMISKGATQCAFCEKQTVDH